MKQEQPLTDLAKQHTWDALFGRILLYDVDRKFIGDAPFEVIVPDEPTTIRFTLQAKIRHEQLNVKGPTLIQWSQTYIDGFEPCKIRYMKPALLRDTGDELIVTHDFKW